MSLRITPAVKGEITRIICPDCGEKIRGIGLMPESRVVGLTFRCRRCGKYWEVLSETGNKI